MKWNKDLDIISINTSSRLLLLSINYNVIVREKPHYKLDLVSSQMFLFTRFIIKLCKRYILLYPLCLVKSDSHKQIWNNNVDTQKTKVTPMTTYTLG